jgi:hypothetical protein
MVYDLSPGAVATTLPETLENRLRSYSIAAAAAGVSMLALVQPADAEVVITHKAIPVNGTVSIDVNHDGIADFQFSNEPGAYYGTLRVVPLAGGAVVLGPPLSSFATALKRDVRIGPHAHFSSKGGADLEISRAVAYQVGTYVPVTVVYFVFGGDWGGYLQNRYLGVKFLIDGETHYGWVRLTVSTYRQGGMYATIDSYAYETDPNTAICAREVQPCPAVDDDAAPGETGQNVSGPSLGMLALGADGLALWRREALAF